MRSLILVLIVCGCGGGGEATWSGHAKQIAVAGKTACALDADGQMWCWGDGAPLLRGALALGPASECIDPFLPSGAASCVTPVALQVTTDLRFEEISAGWDDTFCGRTAEGAVHCWPIVNPACPGVAAPCSRQAEVSGDLTFMSISGMTRGALAVATDGRGYRVGNNVPPLELLGGHHYRQITGGDSFFAGIDADTGSIWEGGIYELPVGLSNITGATRVTEGNHVQRNGCAIDGTGVISCWGLNQWGQLGDGTGFPRRDEPAPILGGAQYTEVSSSGAHVCALKTNGDVECWGWSSRGQIGQAMAMVCPDPNSGGIDWPCIDRPTRVTLPSPATSVSVGPALSCALLADQTVWCWGGNTWGQLGRGSIGEGSTVPERVTGG